MAPGARTIIVSPRRITAMRGLVEPSAFADRANPDRLMWFLVRHSVTRGHRACAGTDPLISRGVRLDCPRAVQGHPIAVAGASVHQVLRPIVIAVADGVYCPVEIVDKLKCPASARNCEFLCLGCRDQADSRPPTARVARVTSESPRRYADPSPYRVINQPKGMTAAARLDVRHRRLNILSDRLRCRCSSDNRSPPAPQIIEPASIIQPQSGCLSGSGDVAINQTVATDSPTLPAASDATSPLSLEGPNPPPRSSSSRSLRMLIARHC